MTLCIYFILVFVMLLAIYCVGMALYLFMLAVKLLVSSIALWLRKKYHTPEVVCLPAEQPDASVSDPQTTFIIHQQDDGQYLYGAFTQVSDEQSLYVQCEEHHIIE